METNPAAPSEARGALGESAIIVPVRVPAVVSRLRERMDPSAAVGVPAHVTLIYPFLPPSSLGDGVRRTVERIIAAEPAFPVVLGSIGRFPNVVYLEPQPVEPFLRLTAGLASAFPDFPPYEGAHDHVIPHLTVAQDVPDDHYEAAEHALAGVLPIRDIAREAWLIGHTPDQAWNTLWRLPLGRRRPAYPGAG